MRRSVLVCLCIALAAVLSVGGTIAYLTDTDAAVNVMTVGNVSINQLELQRKDPAVHTGTLENGDLVSFVQNQPLYPAYSKNEKPTDYSAEADNLLYWGPYVTAEGAGNGLWNPDNLVGAIDKFVFVENDGSSDAYYRTVFAFECPVGAEYSQGWDKQFMMNVNGHSNFDWEEHGYVTIEGVRYLLMSATYNVALAPDEISRPSLLQVVMTHRADNDTVEALGDTYEIKVVTQATQTTNFPDAATALDVSFGELSVDSHPWMDMNGKTDEEGDQAPDAVDDWDGTADTSWYNEEATVFTISTAEQLAGLADLVDGGTTFEGKTVRLETNVDLYLLGDDGEPVCFEPIGSYRNDTPFKGTFDGQGHTISNMYQNTWALSNGYYYNDLGMGLFGKVEDATIKDLNIDGASISGESGLCGTVAAAAYGECTFEDITVSNSDVADYQYYAGGVVGWASGNHKYINCSIEDTTTLAAQWGDFNNANGGIIGGAGSSGTYHFENCDVACRIDSYNDVTSAYQWYSYRRSGMLIGDTGHTKEIDGTTYADAPNVTAVNCTVTYGDWANYHYCEFKGMNYPWVRVEEGVSNSAYSNPRYGHPTDANGNTVTDDTHVHSDGEKHNELIVFDQLFGGPTGDRYCTYGTATHPGVTVIYNNK